jgi:hypothetical protein
MSTVVELVSLVLATFVVQLVSELFGLHAKMWRGMYRLAVRVHGDRVRRRPDGRTKLGWRSREYWLFLCSFFGLFGLVLLSFVATVNWIDGSRPGWPLAPIAITTTAILARPLLKGLTWFYTLD